ncbi:muscle M-line assembly protein unc-89-like [Anoplophora glabripennis]|nr:muscle M-line assembly protein unc-89-like [Anoplophora glabripennis]
MGDSKKLSTSDDEDLEALRLAALRTIKKKNASLYDSLHAHHTPQRSPEKFNRFNRSMKVLQNKRGRFFGPHQGRNGKNGQFNNRNRNSNLISIPTMASEEKQVQQKETADSGVIVNLPQRKYCDETTQETGKEEGTSKFSRYNKSDESESESEEEKESASEDDSPGKLHKADSLEALMQELDDEIQGKSKPKGNLPARSEKQKVKKIKKKNRTACDRVSTSDSDAKPPDQVAEKPESDTNVEVIRHTYVDKVSTEDEVKHQTPEKQSSDEPSVENKPVFSDTYSPAKKRHRSRSPVNRRGFSNRRRPRNFHKFQNSPLQNIPFLPPIGSYPPPVHQFPNPPFNPLFAPPSIGMISQPPPFFERPLSPLAINTESLTTATLAPLSPRSAAFVLENKAIIERRKRSPRRSYSRSRSTSRSPRRSLTPRRSPRRSVSPRRISRSPRRSPRRKSLSPKRRSLSPRRRTVGRTADNSPKNRAPVRERLGLKNKTEDVKDKPKNTQSTSKKDDKPLDPILEARKRKFESNEIKIREGIIRLKPKEEKLEEDSISTSIPASDVVSVLHQVSTSKLEDVVQEKSSEIKTEKPQELDVIEELENLLKEDPMLEADDIEVNPKVADIFSDEDSASDNEGRFKVKEGTSTKPPVLSFTKLMNGEKREIKAEPLPDTKRSERRRDRRDRIGKSRTRGRSPAERKDIAKENAKGEGDRKPGPKKSESQDKSHAKSQISIKNDRHVTPMERRFERKIEIKIKNPSKYERGTGKFKFNKDGEEKLREEVKRKVELNKGKTEEEEEEPEIVVENNSGDDENSLVSEGDLRAQLSKKRAEKLHRIPVEGISSRLLQNALQGAVFKKTKKKSKEQDITSSDAKLPIHLRLGIANGSDVFADTTTKVKRKSRKRKNREVLEQV